MKLIISKFSGKEISTATREDGSLPDDLSDNDYLWIDAEGYDQEFLKLIEKRYHVDPLTTEDILHGNQRVKSEEYENYTFCVSKSVFKVGDDNFTYGSMEIFIIIMEKVIITMHGQPSDVLKHTLDSITNRAKNNLAMEDFPSLVMHHIFDFSVDSFFSALSNLENWLASVQVSLLDVDSISSSQLASMKKMLSFISRARSEMGKLRSTLTQHRDVMSLAQNDAIKFVSSNLSPMFRDVYDHTFQLIEQLDSYTLRAGDIRDLYFTLRSAFTDNILRLLTIVATIFLPLTFLTGFYGMNFVSGNIYFQPGTSTAIGFDSFVFSLVVISGILLAIFRKKGWV